MTYLPDPAADLDRGSGLGLRGVARAPSVIAIGTCAVALAVFFGASLADPAAGAESADSRHSLDQIRDTLDDAKKLTDDGKPGKAAGRVAEAAKAIEAAAAEEGASTALRSLWERCRSMRNDLELEGVDVGGITLAPLKGGNAQSAARKTSPPKPTGKPPRKDMAAAPPAAGSARPSPKPAAKPALAFSTQIAPILSRHCGGCHVGGRKGGFQMASYAGLMKTGMVQPGVGESSRLVEVILSGDMPRGGGKVSADDIGLLMKWIDAGAPYDGSDPTVPLDVLARSATAPPPAVPPTKPIVAAKLAPGEVSFAADIAPVLVAQCVGCHDAMQPEANLSMVTLERLLRGGRGGSPVVSGKGAESLLVKKLKGAGIEGQRMPLGKPPLADDQIATIQKWIDQGLKLDLLTPQTDLETVAAAGRSRRFSHEELRGVRFQAGNALWSRAIPDEAAAAFTRGDVLTLGNLSAAKTEQFAETSDSVAGRLHEEIMGGKAPLIKGGVVIYCFAKSYDLSSFWETVFADDRPKGAVAAGGVLGDVVFAAIVSIDKEEPAANSRALLAEQITAAALLDRGAPKWFARGAARAVAMKFEPKAGIVESWRRDLPAAVQRCGSPADFFAGHGDPLAATTVGGGFIVTILPNVGRLGAILAQLDAGTPFDQAFATVFRGQPQPLFEAWVAQQSNRGPRK